LALLLFGWTAVRLAERAREEHADRTLALLVDWYEIRDFAARQNLPNDELLQLLRRAGMTGLAVGEATLQEYFAKPWKQPERPIPFAPQVKASPAWTTLKDVEVGFDTRLLELLRARGIPVVYRVDHEPWTDPKALFTGMERILSRASSAALLFGSDEIPGGADAMGFWTSLLRAKGLPQLLFEFRPPRAAVRLAQSLPAHTYRAHTIQTAELKDFSEDQETFRWHRAVEERSCRFLLVHTSPNDSLPTFFDRLTRLGIDLQKRGWSLGWPMPRPTWSSSSFMQRRVAPWLALGVAILAPLVALRLSTARQLGARHQMSFWAMSLGTVGGACVAAAIAQSPETQLQITPFLGTKLAFLLTWGGSFFLLYRKEELRAFLTKNVRWLDVGIGVVLAAVAAYLLIRSGNAGVSWKSGWEQTLRERLEDLLVARPRFKEFALGHPLLLFGLYLKTSGRAGFWRDGRLWMGLGMVGQVSIVNTFCHLHSPLLLAFWRTANGLILGSLFGGLVILLYDHLRRPAQRFLKL
jgi:hypothetical protein